MKENSKRHIVIIGGGFGRIATANKLKRSDADVTIIDKSNHHLFQPLLYQMATAALSPLNEEYNSSQIDLLVYIVILSKMSS